jgi:protein tyrosine/serine phosphatase
LIVRLRRSHAANNQNEIRFSQEGAFVRVHRNVIRVTASSMLLGLAFVASAAAAGVRIDNFGRVNATYYRGAQPEGQDYADLAALGVKTVINLTSDDAEANEPSMVKSAGMTYFQIPMTTHREPTSAEIAQFLKIVNDPKNQPVYVHCVGGRHRTGVMTAVYRMTNNGWSADQAFSEMKQYKYGADFLHSEFKQFVYAYPAELARVAAASTAAPAGAGAARTDAKLQK